MNKAAALRLKFWTPNVALLIFFMVSAAVFSYFRFFHGFGSVTNLNPNYPMGMWIAFDVACGVALAAGGFTTCLIVEIFGKHKYHALLRPAILTAFIGYMLVGMAVMFDLGRWYYIWHALIYWNGNSVLFEVAWCVMLYLSVLAVENVPAVVEEYKDKVDLPGPLAMFNSLTNAFLHVADKVMGKVAVFFVLGGVVLSFGHQSSLGTMMLIAPYKLHELWFTPWSPLLFLMSAIAVGPSMVVFEASLATYFFNRKSEINLIGDFAKFIPWFLGAFLLFRFGDLAWRGALPAAFVPGKYAYAFWVEMALFIIPFVVLMNKRVRFHSLKLFLAACSVICGVVAYRFNVFLIGMDMGPGWNYFPSVGEFAVTFGFVAFGLFLYKLAVNYLPILERQH